MPLIGEAELSPISAKNLFSLQLFVSWGRNKLNWGYLIAGDLSPRFVVSEKKPSK
jgi:hypothetical protein